MIKRSIAFGSYDTAANGWTLTGWKLSAAEQKTNYIDKTGGDGSHDLSTVLTDGIMRYRDRVLTVSLETSQGNRLNREAEIRRMINTLDGMRLDIELPDDPHHHLDGRIHVVREYNDLAHAAVTVTATCKPWKYQNLLTEVILTAKATEQTAQIINSGRLTVVPTITVTGTEVRLIHEGASLTLAPGEYQWPELLLTPGSHDLSYIGSGIITLTYREAVLE